MTTTHAPARISNGALGQLIGLDHSSVSRLRRGERRCSVTVMANIEGVTGWPISAQHAAFNRGTFPKELETHFAEYLAEHAAPCDDDTPAGV